MKLGILGGTFDPVHYGHLLVAEEARSRAGLQRVLFCPAGQPRLRTSEPEASAHHRLEMVRRAVQGNPKFGVSSLEIGRKGTTYTVDTLETLCRVEGPETDLYFIMGADTLEEFGRWKEPGRVLELCRLVVVQRPGYADPRTQRIVRDFPTAQGRVLELQGPRCELSASTVRQQAAMGLSLDGLVPEEVKAYIYEQGLYRRKEKP
jgi:nicotinate-nucleotide adenylyltransferase